MRTAVRHFPVQTPPFIPDGMGGKNGRLNPPRGSKKAAQRHTKKKQSSTRATVCRHTRCTFPSSTIPWQPPAFFHRERREWGSVASAAGRNPRQSRRLTVSPPWLQPRCGRHVPPCERRPPSGPIRFRRSKHKTARKPPMRSDGWGEETNASPPFR